MTTLGTPEIMADQSPPTGAHRRRWIVAASALLVLLIALVAWVRVAEGMRSHVSAQLAMPMTCSGTTVQSPPTGVGLPARLPVVKLAPKMSCDLQIEFVNDGSRSVRIVSASFPVLGARAAGGARLTGPGLASNADNADAVFTIDRELRAHSTLLVAYELRFRPQGCDSTGAIESQTQEPLVKVSALGLTGAVHGQVSFGWRGTPSSSCDSAG